MVPSWVAFAVIGLLEQHFSRLVDYDFTAAMEDELDAIAGGLGKTHQLVVQLLLRWEHGVEGSVARARWPQETRQGPTSRDIDARTINSIKLFDDEEGRAVNVRVAERSITWSG